jgi:hypothetical protein
MVGPQSEVEVFGAPAPGALGADAAFEPPFLASTGLASGDFAGALPPPPLSSPFLIM